LRATWNTDCAGRTDGEDFAVLNDDDAIGNFSAADWDDVRAGLGDRSGLGESNRGEKRCEEEGISIHSRMQMVTQTLRSALGGKGSSGFSLGDKGTLAGP
jgi:hypothetical protein